MTVSRIHDWAPGEVLTASDLNAEFNNLIDSLNTADVVVGITATGSSTARLLADRFAEVTNVKDFGAVGDGSTDDYTAINAAITYAGANGVVYFPQGTYIVGTMLVASSNSVKFVGDGETVSILKRKGGATIDALLHIGPTSGTGATIGVIVEGLGFDGNSGCTDAVIKCRNMQYASLRHLNVYSGTACGIRTDTSTTTINTQAFRNEFIAIRSSFHGTVGMKFQGEKDSRFVDLLSYSNTSHGFEFKAFKDDGNQLCETTQCTLGVLISRDNGGNGFTFDAVEKYVAASLISTINTGYGMQFLSSQTGAASNGSNSLICANYLSRNDQTGGIRMADNCSVDGATFGVAHIIGYSQSTGAVGWEMAGVNRVHIASVQIVGGQGDAMRLEQGTPFGGGATECRNIQIGIASFTDNGNVGSSANNGLRLKDSATNVIIGSLYSANAQTTGGHYEINADNGVGPVYIHNCVVNPNAGANGFSIGSADIHLGIVKNGTNTPVLILKDNVTAPGGVVVASTHAQIYIDGADGDLKIRFGDGTVKTIVVDT